MVKLYCELPLNLLNYVTYIIKKKCKRQHDLAKLITFWSKVLQVWFIKFHEVTSFSNELLGYTQSFSCTLHAFGVKRCLLWYAKSTLGGQKNGSRWWNVCADGFQSSTLLRAFGREKYALISACLLLCHTAVCQQVRASKIFSLISACSAAPDHYSTGRLKRKKLRNYFSRLQRGALMCLLSQPKSSLEQALVVLHIDVESEIFMTEMHWHDTKLSLICLPQNALMAYSFRWQNFLSKHKAWQICFLQLNLNVC